MFGAAFYKNNGKEHSLPSNLEPIQVSTELDQGFQLYRSSLLVKHTVNDIKKKQRPQSTGRVTHLILAQGFMCVSWGGGGSTLFITPKNLNGKIEFASL